MSPHWRSRSCRARTILTPFSSAFTPIASPCPPGPDRERPVGGVGRLAGHGRLEPAEPGRRGRDRERARRVGGLGDDGGVGAEAGLDAGEGAERDLGRLLADDRVQLQVAGEPDSGVRERPGREPHGDGRGLHVGRAEPVEAPVDDLRAPGAAADPLARDRRHGVDVAVEDQRAPASGARADADEVDAIGVLGDPVGGRGRPRGSAPRAGRSRGTRRRRARRGRCRGSSG